MKQERKIPLKDYIAGGAVANAITWIVLGIGSSTVPPNFFIATYLVGSLFGGFLVGRKIKQEYVKTGLLTGIFSFVVHVYVFLGVFWLLSVSTPPLEWHAMIFSVLLLGSCLGVFLSKFIVLGRYAPAKEAS